MNNRDRMETRKNLRFKISSLSSPTIFDQMNRLESKPYLAGSLPSTLITNWCFFRREDGKYLEDEVDQELMDQNIPRVVDSYPGQLCTVNMEAYSFHANSKYGQAVNGWKQLNRIIDTVSRLVDVGFYRLFPIKDVRVWRKGEKERAEWWYRNELNYKNFGYRLDYFAPSLYFDDRFHESFEDWTKFADAHLDMIREFNGGKPVCVYLSPRTYPFGPDDPLLPYDLVRSMLEYCLFERGTHVLLYDSKNDWTGEDGQKAVTDVLVENFNAMEVK